MTSAMAVVAAEVDVGLVDDDDRLRMRGDQPFDLGERQQVARSVARSGWRG